MESRKFQVQLMTEEVHAHGAGVIKVVKVPGDGNCFFYAVVQQLSGWTTFDRKFMELAKDLRQEVVCHIRQHLEEFEEVLAGEIITRENENGECFGGIPLGPVTPTKIDTFLNELKKDGAWGGAESLKAMGRILGADIRVYTPVYGPMKITYRDGILGDAPKIELFFNGADHYDSILKQDTIENEQESGSYTKNKTIEMKWCEAEDTRLDEMDVTENEWKRVSNGNEEIAQRTINRQDVIMTGLDDELNDSGRNLNEMDVNECNNGMGNSVNEKWEMVEVGQKYWVEQGSVRFKVIRMVKHKDSYLHAISHQLSGINPNMNTFGILPDALLTDIRKFVGWTEGNDYLLNPCDSLWNSFAQMMGRKISVISWGEGMKEFEPNRIESKSEVMLFAFYQQGKLQVDSIERIYKNQKPNKEMAQLNMQSEIIKIATLNIRGCCRNMKRMEIDAELNSFGVHVAVLQEVNVNGMMISTPNYEWIISDRKNSNNSRGLAILKNKNSKITVNCVKNVNKNIISAIIKNENGNELLVVDVHAPNGNANSFYAELGSCVSETIKKDKMIILGDFNSQIGREDLDEEEKELLGEYIGHEHSNENGEFMKMFLRMHKMKISSMNYGQSLLTTWSNGTHKSQIDHVVNSVDCSYEIKYIRATWTSIRTDHKLIIVGIKLGDTLKTHDRMKLKRKIEPSNLKDTKIQKLYHENLETNKKICLDAMDTTEAYGLLLEKINISAKKTLTEAKPPLSPKRISALKAVKRAKERMRLAKERGIEIEYYEREVKIANELVKIKIKEHKEREIYEFYNNLKDYEVGERIKRSYRFLKKFLNDKKKKNPIIPMKKWVEELNKSAGELMNIPADREELTNAPTRTEIESIIRKLANGKAAGKDGLRNEYLKYATENVIEELWNIIKKVHGVQ